MLVESDSWTLKSGIQLKESGIPLTIEIQNPSSTDKSVPGILNPRLFWIPLHEARAWFVSRSYLSRLLHTWIV